MYWISFTLMAMCVPSTAPNTFGNAAISKNFCLTRICSAAVDGNLIKFFTILLRALDMLKIIRETLDWLIPTVLLKTAWNDPEANNRSATIICSITGSGEDLFFSLQIISQNMGQIHYWVSRQPTKSKQSMIRKGERICSISKRPFWLSLPTGNPQYFHLKHRHLINQVC